MYHLQYKHRNVNTNFDDSKCVRDIESVLQGLKHGKEWALRMLDSSTKLPNGLMTGNLIDYGNYDECISVSPSEKDFTGQHCMASFTYNSTTQGVANELGITPTFLWSYCVPSSCSANFLQRENYLLHNYTSTFDSLLFGNGVVSVNVNQEDCHTSETTPLRPVDWFSISFFCLFILIALVSTAYDVYLRKHKNKSGPDDGMVAETGDIWTSFSLYTNGKKLFSTKSTPGNMSVLNGMRFISMSWIILGHRYFFMSTSSVMNLLDIQVVLQEIQYQLLIGANLAVDTFFFMSGLLNSYNVLRLMDKTRQFPVIKYYLHRYLRTTPALAMIVFMYATWYVHLGTGPAWDRNTQLHKMLCEAHWWPTLLYINNYYNPVEQCAGQSWYLAVDMQLFWLSPLVVLPLWKWPKFGRWLLGIVAAISIIIPFVVSYVYDIRAPFTVTRDMEEYKKVTAVQYVPTHMRATPYVFGLVFGYILVDMKRKDVSFKMKPVFVVIAWTLSILLCLSALLGMYQFFLPLSEHPYNKIESSLYISLHRVAWSVGIGWIIFACLHGHGGPVNSFLSWKLFIPLSKMSYCMFLTHLAIQTYQLAVARTTDYYSDFNQFHRNFGDLIFTIIFSVLLTLLFESPILIIEKSLFNVKKTNSDRPTNFISRSDNGNDNPTFTIENENLSKAN